MISLIRVVFHLSVGCCYEMRVGKFDLPGTAECHLAVEVSQQNTCIICFWETNGADLSNRVVVPWKDVRFCGADIDQFILHDSSLGIEAVHGEIDSRGDVGAIQLVGVVGGHGAISFEFHGSINRETFWKALPSEVRQSVWVMTEHRDSILQDMAQHLPGHGKCACRAYCVNVEVTVWEFRGSVTDHLKFLAPDVTIDDGSVCHISLE